MQILFLLGIDITKTGERLLKGCWNSAEVLKWNIKEKKGKISPDGEVLEKDLCQGKHKMKKKNGNKGLGPYLMQHPNTWVKHEDWWQIYQLRSDSCS